MWPTSDLRVKQDMAWHHTYLPSALPMKTSARTSVGSVFLTVLPGSLSDLLTWELTEKEQNGKLKTSDCMEGPIVLITTLITYLHSRDIFFILMSQYKEE